MVHWFGEMKHIIIALVALLSVLHREQLLTTATGCPRRYLRRINGKCYYFSVKKMNWFGALNNCLRKGLTLADLSNPKDFNGAIDFLSSKGNTEDFWFGGNDLQTEGRFQYTSNGRLVRYFSNYSIVEAAEHSECDDCLEVRIRNNMTVVADDNCLERQYFICSERYCDYGGPAKPRHHSHEHLHHFHHDIGEPSDEELMEEENMPPTVETRQVEDEEVASEEGVDPPCEECDTTLYTYATKLTSELAPGDASGPTTESSASKSKLMAEPGDSTGSNAGDGDEEAPAGETNVTGEDGEAPAEGAETNAEDGEGPAEETEAKAEDGEAPAEGTEAKAEDGEAPAEGAEVKAEDGEAPAEGTEAKAEDGEAPADGAEVKAEDGEAPTEETEAKAVDEEAPAEGAEAPSEGGEAPSAGGEASAAGGEASAAGGEAPDEGGEARAGNPEPHPSDPDFEAEK